MWGCALGVKDEVERLGTGVGLANWTKFQSDFAPLPWTGGEGDGGEAGAFGEVVR